MKGKYQEVHDRLRNKILNIFSDYLVIWSQKQLCYSNFNS